jgi:hypothetical protein
MHNFIQLQCGIEDKNWHHLNIPHTPPKDIPTSKPLDLPDLIGEEVLRHLIATNRTVQFPPRLEIYM